MKIQSISIVVPTKRCVNNCPFCVSRMHSSEFENNFNPHQYRKRIRYAAMNGVTTLIITGTGEALQNKPFLENLRDLLESEDRPFPNIELQTTGVLLNKKEEVIDQDTGNLGIDFYNLNLLGEIGVNTISLSVSDVFNDENNLKIMGTPDKLKFKLGETIKILKLFGFNVRLSLNLLNIYNPTSPEQLIDKCKRLGADQITFRKMYFNKDLDCEENKWTEKHKLTGAKIIEIKNHIIKNGDKLYTLPFGADVYSINGMSVAVDSDCMSKNDTDSLKYVILRENSKLYCRWDDEGSLIF